MQAKVINVLLSIVVVANRDRLVLLVLAKPLLIELYVVHFDQVGDVFELLVY